LARPLSRRPPVPSSPALAHPPGLHQRGREGPAEFCGYSEGRAGGALLAEHDVRLDGADARKRQDPAAEDALEVGEVAGNDLEAVVEDAEDVLDDLDLGDGLDGTLEGLEVEAAAHREADAEEDDDGEAEPGAVEDEGAAADHARLLEPADAAPGGGLAQANGGADLLGVEAAIGEQRPQDGAVGVVEVDQSGNLIAAAGRSS
jgi:hypothetical protein